MSRTSTETTGRRRVALDGPTMGSRWTAVWFDDGGVDAMAVGRALAAAAGAVDDRMSTWKPDSDLMRLNRAPVGPWLDVPADLALVLATALEIGRDSGGAFDVGVGRLVADWGFGAHAGRPDRLAAAPAGLDVPTLEVDVAAARVRKLAPTALDLSGIAKGFGVDELSRVLDAAGIAAHLVGIDGEMRARGEKPDGKPWTVAVERPEPGVRAVHGLLALVDCAVATSGDYRHFRGAGADRVAHTIDPRTGRPVRNAVASVTVLAPTAMVADAAATAVTVLGADDGLAFARRLGLDALVLVRRPDGTLDERATGRLAAQAAASASAGGGASTGGAGILNHAT